MRWTRLGTVLSDVKVLSVLCKGIKRQGHHILILFGSVFLASCDRGARKGFRVPLCNFKTAQSMATKITQSNVLIICNIWA